MNPIALIFFLICAVALLLVPRKWASAVLLVGCTYMTLGQGIQLLSISLPIYRMMLLVGLLRVITKGEYLVGGLNTIDKIMLVWGGWVVFAGFFHDQERYSVIYSCGSVFNLTLIYFLLRIWCTDLGEVRDVIRIVAVILVPLAAEMVLERITGKNLFSIFGGVSENVQFRSGKFRAQGPFLHAILAGTVGATCIPLFVGILARDRFFAIIGIVAGLVMTVASASSGPIMSLIFGIGALLLWHFRSHMKEIRIGVIVGYLVLMVVMKQPPYYLMGRIDISGGSTGWHRANLIEMTFKHLSEWWLFGTDITRHWMPAQGIAMDPLHTDVTNYFIGIGILGGLPAMLLILGMMGVAFKWVGRILTLWSEKSPEEAFMIWCFGACLFSHVVTGVSVAYFDQSIVYFWLVVAVISSLHSIAVIESNQAPLIVDDDIGNLEKQFESIFRPEAACSNVQWRREHRARMATGIDPYLTNNHSRTKGSGDPSHKADDLSSPRFGAD